MASMPPYSGYPSYCSLPGSGRLNAYPGANNQNAFPPQGLGASCATPTWSVSASPTSLNNNAGNNSAKPANNSEDKRSLKTIFWKCGLEILVGLAAFPFGARLGERHLIKQCGAWADKVGGFGLSFILSAFTGGIFSCVYQKVKNGAINANTLLNDTLWGGIGG